MIPTAFNKDDELSGPGSEWGTYRFDDGTERFGQRDPELDALMAPVAAPAAVLEEPTLETEATPAGGTAVDGTGLVLSDEPTPFSEPIDQTPIGEEPQRGGLEEMNARQMEERAAAQEELDRQTMMAQERQLRQAEQDALTQMESQKLAQRQAQRDAAEHSAKLERLKAERSAVEQADLKYDFSRGDNTRFFLTVLAGALAGYVGSDSTTRMIERDHDRWAKKQLAIKNSKLDRLADQLGSEEKALAASRAAAYQAAEGLIEEQGKLQLSQRERENLPLVAAQLKAKRVEAAQEFERKSMEAELGYAQDQADLGLKERGADLAEAKFGHQKSIDWARLAQQKREGEAKAGAPTGPSAFPGAQEEAKIRRNELAIAYPGLNPAQREEKYAKFEKEYRKDAIDLEGYEVLEQALDNAHEGQDVSGFGRFASSLPDEWAGPEGRGLRQEFGAAISKYMKEISGAAVTEQEFERIQQTVLSSKTYDEMKRGIRLLSRDVRARVEAARGGSNQVLAQIADAAIARSRERDKSVQQAIDSQRKAKPKPKKEEEKPTGSAPAIKPLDLSRFNYEGD